MATLYSYFKVPEYHPLVFIDRWGFTYNIDENGLLGNSLSPYSHYENLQKKFLGIKVNHYNIEDHQVFYNHLKNEFALNLPVIAYVDSYLSPWDNYFHKSHGAYSIILTGIDTEKNEIYCSDRYYSNKIETISFTQASTMFYSYSTVELTNRVNIKNEYEYNILIYNHMKQILNDDIFNNVMSFANFLETSFNIQDEIYRNIDETYCFYNISLCTSLNSIAYSRTVFTRALEYIKFKYRKYDLDYFIDNILLIATQWQTVNHLIMKNVVIKKSLI